MKQKEIHLGFEIETGKKIGIRQSHIVVTGVTQMSGKTTTLEGLIQRSGYKAIIFKTKKGEKGITQGTIIPPFFQEKFDWEEAASLLEASRKEKLKFERSWIIKYSKGATSLIEFKANIDKAMAEGKLRELDKSVLLSLQAYLDKILPELQYTPFSKTLELADGVNIMDLERFSDEVQHIVLKSVLEKVLNEMKDVIVVVPEAWKFIPQDTNTPCKRNVESFIRQGAANGNYVWIDSQDLRGVDKLILRQVTTWIMGLQGQKDEVKSTLDQIPLPQNKKPKPNEIMSLQKGHFIVATPRMTKTVYVQPAWLDDKTARQVAEGKKDVEDIEKPEKMVPYSRKIETTAINEVEPAKADKRIPEIKREIIEMREDFFNKLEEQKGQINRIMQDLFYLRNNTQGQDIDEASIVSKVLQKIPTGTTGNKEEIITEVMSRMPKGAGAVTYEVAPLEKIKKDFLEETKNKLLTNIGNMDENSKRMLKYLESKGSGVSTLELEEKCFLMKHSGAAKKKVSNASIELRSVEVAHKNTDGKHHGDLKKRISELMTNHGATEQEVNQVYDHVLAEMLNGQ